jgi:general secretion pathway protein E/type IV pilus assembly protein PilB
MSSLPRTPSINPPLSAKSSVPPGSDADAVGTLDQLLVRALSVGGSDLHLEPKEDSIRVRIRVDGVMVDQPALPLALCTQLVSRIKVMARMDIAERRNPQDGMFKLEVAGKPVSVRASTFPCVDGEKVVLRLHGSTAVMPIDRLGMTGTQSKLAEQLIARPGGLVLCTGPTGSGKTSTLYALLATLDTVARNVVTLEDPIEVQLPQVTQAQVQPKVGFTFANGLRAILRQDPDVILVGEMRDEETASIALQAGLTGHLVLSTLHTGSSIETISRLIDIGIVPHTVANALNGVICQRLVRRPCAKCAEPYELDRDVTEEVGFALPLGAKLLGVNGCDACLHTGYRGRVGIYEVVPINDRLRSAIKRGNDTPLLKQILREQGIPTLRRAGMALALRGGTTPNEVLRVT